MLFAWNIPTYQNGPKDMLQSSERGQTLHLKSLHHFYFFHWKGRCCDRNIRWVCLHFQIGELKQFTTSDRRKGQRLEVKLFDDSVSSFPLIWCVMLLYSFSKWIKIYYLCCFCAIFHLIGPCGSPLCIFRLPQIYSGDVKLLINLLNSMCVWFSLCSSLSNPLTSTVPLTAGTERPFSSCKLWYPKRRVG